MDSDRRRIRIQMDIAIVYILISVLGGALGQILLKRGMTDIGPLTLTSDTAVNILTKMIVNPYVVIGLAIYVCSTFFWLTALSRVDLSFAYPFASLSYILMLIASWLIFHENITPLRLLGTGVIAFGVFIVSRS
jgi:uncharacterized membrane protein